MARGNIPLLLVISLAIATTLSTLSTRIEGSFVGERSNSISSSSEAALDSSSSSNEHKLQQGEISFKSEAYAATWDPPDHHQSHDNIDAHQNSFEPEVYPVRWKQSNHQLQGDVIVHQSSFAPEAYAVTWDPDHQSHDDVATHQNSFEPEAYPVTWKQPNQQLQGDVAVHQSSFVPKAYAVTWDPLDHQSHDDVATHQNSFEPEAYPVRWKQPNQQLQGDVAARPNSFTPEAYAATWDPPDQQSHGDGDLAARQDQQSQGDGDLAARQNSFEPEAYKVVWKQPAQAPDAADEAAAARDHGLHVKPGMVFTRKSLLPGTVLPEGTKFAGDGFPDTQRFVLRADADAIPFRYSQLDTILRMFRIPRGSKKAEQVAATLRTCEAVDESPDPHTCATSEQAATDFAAASLGVRTASELVAVVTVVHGSKDAARYVVAPDGIARIGKEAGGAAVPCHPMAYPYMVHYCHRPADVEALRVELTGLGDDGAAATTAIAMCHSNTTSWDARYFEMLNATRGEEICHFMPRNYVLWLPAADLQL